jgi:hypothetical protein
MIRNLSLLLLGCVALLSIGSESAIAQRDATSKARGDYRTYFSGHSAGRSVRHARDYSHGLQNYSRAPVPIPREVAKREATAIQQNLTAAKQEYSAIRKSAGPDKELTALLDAIDQHVATADEALMRLHKCCEVDEVDSKMVAECCTDIDSALEKVHAEHEKLMKRLDQARGQTKSPQK